MNLFYLDRDPAEAARMQCDRHVVKMILETAQMLSTAHIELDGRQVAYKSTHKNHPSTVWVRGNTMQYRWAWQHLKALGDEYTRRYGKVHKTIREHLDTLAQYPENLAYGELIDPPQCMYDDCKHADTVIAYQQYYNAKADEWSVAGRPMTWGGNSYD